MGLPTVMFDLAEGHAMAGDAAAYAEGGDDPRALARTMLELLDDQPRRERMAPTPVLGSRRCSTGRSMRSRTSTPTLRCGDDLRGDTFIMCGIAGYVARATENRRLRRSAKAMADAIAHRGPDDAGTYFAATIGDWRVGFGFRAAGDHRSRRRGAQPMIAPDGTSRSSSTARSTTSASCAPSSRRGAHASDRQRHRGAAPWLADWGDRVRRAAQRHVRLRALGRATAPPVPGARPLRGEAARYRDCRDGRLAFASEIKALLALPGVPPQPRSPTRSGYLGLRYVPGRRRCSRGSRSSRRAFPAARRGKRGAETIASGTSTSRIAPARGCLDAPDPARRVERLRTVRLAGDRGRAAGRVPLRWDRLVGRRRADGPPNRAAGLHVLHRLRRGEIQRAALRQPRRRAAGLRPPPDRVFDKRAHRRARPGDPLSRRACERAGRPAAPAPEPPCRRDAEGRAHGRGLRRAARRIPEARIRSLRRAVPRCAAGRRPRPPGRACATHAPLPLSPHQDARGEPRRTRLRRTHDPLVRRAVGEGAGRADDGAPAELPRATRRPTQRSAAAHPAASTRTCGCPTTCSSAAIA